jgi:hypothetical protein
MADPFQKLGISRTPAYELFGTPNVSRGGFSNATREAVAADQAALDEAQALQDERDARARARQAEQVADQVLAVKEPTAREKMLGENPAVARSKSFGDIMEFQKAQPSYADKVLAKSIALKFEDADARTIFQNELARGKGSLAAQDSANTFLAKKQAAGELGKAGYSPDEAEVLVAARHDPAYVNYHVAQKKEGTMFHKDPQAQAMENHLRIVKNRAAFELKEKGEVSPETEAEQIQIEQLLAGKYKGVYQPGVTAPGVAAPVVPATSVDAAAALRRKLGLVKP